MERRAGEGNRTLVISLEGRCEPPQNQAKFRLVECAKPRFWTESLYRSVLIGAAVRRDRESQADGERHLETVRRFVRRAF